MIFFSAFGKIMSWGANLLIDFVLVEESIRDESGWTCCVKYSDNLLLGNLAAYYVLLRS